MVSKTRMLSLVQDFNWKEVKQALREKPELVRFRDKKGRNWLHLCCSIDILERKAKAADSIRTAETLLNAGLEINEPASTKGTWKATALWYSIAFGQNLALSRYLLKRGSDPNHCLWAAVNRDNAPAIRLLIENGAEDPTSDESSPLLAAIQWGKFAAAEELLRLGADPNFQDRKGMTPLHYLLRKGSDKKHVRMLVKHGARGDLKDERGAMAGDIMRRKRDSEFRDMAAQLATGS